MKSLARILTLIFKEFAIVLRDPQSRVVVIIPPLIQFFVFGYAATFDLHNVRYAIFDEAKTSISRMLLSDFEGSKHFEKVDTLINQQQIEDTINNQKARLVIHIPSDFSKSILSGKPTDIQVIVDGRNSNVASIALVYVNTIVNNFNKKVGNLYKVNVNGGAVPKLIERSWFNENLESRWFIVSALGGIISMIVVMILSSLSVAREREFGTFDQLLVAPFRPYEILIGKAVPTMIFGMFDALLLSVAGVFWFHVPFRGSILALIIVLFSFMLAVVGVGLFVSSISRTMQQGLLGSFVFIMPAVILGGFTTPIENMPHWLQIGTLVNPLRYVVKALREIFLLGAGLNDAWPQIWPMLIIACVTLPIASWMFRHRTT